MNAHISIPRPMTVSEATAAFEDAANRQDTLTCFIHQDVTAIQASADILARAVAAIGLLYSRMDTAKRTTDARGAATRPAPTMNPADLDEYALVESLYWDRLSPEAETLLKVMLRQALKAAKPEGDHRPEVAPLVESHDEGCHQ